MNLIVRVMTVLLVVVPVFAQDSPASQPAASPIPPPSPTLPPSMMPVPELLLQIERELKMENIDAAKALVDVLLQRDPKNVEGLQFRSELAWQQRDVNLAWEGWREIFAIQKNDFRANFGLGRIHLGKRSWRSARNYLSTALVVAPSDRRGEVLAGLARAYRGDRMLSKAREAIDNALEEDPTNFEARMFFVGLLAETDELARSVEESDKLIELAMEVVRGAPADVAALDRWYMAYDVQIEVLQAQNGRLFAQNADGTMSDRLLPGMLREARLVALKSIDVRVAQAELGQLLSDHHILALIKSTIDNLGASAELLMKQGLMERRTDQYAAAVKSFAGVLELDGGHPSARVQAIEVLVMLMNIDPDNGQWQQQYDAFRSVDDASSTSQPAEDSATAATP